MNPSRCGCMAVSAHMGEMMIFRVLGGLEVRHHGVHVALGGPRQRAVLAALLLHTGQSVSLGQLTDAVWDRTPATPESKLRTYISGLRSVFERTEGTSGRLVTSGGGYRLEASCEELDLTAFQQQVDRGRKAQTRGELGEAVSCFERALETWRTPPLDGMKLGPGLESEVAYWEEFHLYTVENYVRCMLSFDRHEQVLGMLRKLVATHPLREQLTGYLMLALCRSGRQAEALRAFSDLHSQLSEELGIDPAPPAWELHQRILAGDPELHQRSALDVR